MVTGRRRALTVALVTSHVCGKTGWVRGHVKPEPRLQRHWKPAPTEQETMGLEPPPRSTPCPQSGLTLHRAVTGKGSHRQAQTPGQQKANPLRITTQVGVKGELAPAPSQPLALAGHPPSPVPAPGHVEGGIDFPARLTTFPACSDKGEKRKSVVRLRVTRV